MNSLWTCAADRTSQRDLRRLDSVDSQPSFPLEVYAETKKARRMSFNTWLAEGDQFISFEFHILLGLSWISLGC